MSVLCVSVEAEDAVGLRANSVLSKPPPERGLNPQTDGALHIQPLPLRRDLSLRALLHENDSSFLLGFLCLM